MFEGENVAFQVSRAFGAGFMYVLGTTALKRELER
jgi:hypothetical protein